MIDNFKKVGNAVVLTSPEADYRILDAWGDVVKYTLESGFPVDDTTGDPLGWDTTVIEAGAGDTLFAAALTAGDIATITTAASEYDGGNYQLKGEQYKVATSKPFYFGARVKVSDATQSDLFIGLAETDTTLMAVETAHAISLGGDGLFFSKLDAVTAIYAKNYLDGAETGSAAVGTALDTSYHDYEIFSDGAVIKFYFDKALVTSFSASLADGDMRPSINFRAGAAAAKVLTIARLACFQINS